MRGALSGGLSLANKVQLLFGVAVVFIVSATLVLPWFRVVAIIDEAEFEAVRQFARFWESRPFIDASMNVGWYRETTDGVAVVDGGAAAVAAPAGGAGGGGVNGAGGGGGVNGAVGGEGGGGTGAGPSGTGRDSPPLSAVTGGSGEVVGVPGGGPVRGTALPHEVLGFWPMSDWVSREFRSPFMEEARRAMRSGGSSGEVAAREHRQAVWDGSGGARVYRMARVVSNGRGEAQGVIVVERRSPTAAGQIVVNRLFLVVAGLVAAGLAVGVFFFITKSIILGPVRSLRDTAELVRGGSMHIRSDIRTGDEFEQLAAAFNSMLEAIEKQQAQLKRSNRTLDIQVNRLEEQNRQLNEMSKLKGEFLANISHELRTPLNSIIGFAELLDEIAGAEDRLLAAGEPVTASPKQVAKRRRYIDHIVTAGRRLLEMITELLTMARLEAGRIGVEIGRVEPGEMAEALRALIQPLADRASIDVRLELETVGGGFTDDPSRAGLPSIETDGKKLHQILFNFLSNAVKFTPRDGLIRVRVEAERSGGSGAVAGGGWLRFSVIDNGPGIDPSLHAAVFEKFRQIDGGPTREHQQGTGLGLAIAKEFADMIGGRITLDSAPGRGSAFSVVVPIEFARAAVEGGAGAGAAGGSAAEGGVEGGGVGEGARVASGPGGGTARTGGAGRSELWRE